MNNFTYESFKEAYLEIYLPYYISEYNNGEPLEDEEEIIDVIWTELLSGGSSEDKKILDQIGVEIVAENQRDPNEDSNFYTVFKYKNNFYRYDYTYTSYYGSTHDNEEFTEVKPRQVVSTVYD